MQNLVSLPSLDLLKGFVAVGRRMSITLAAEDLCLTQSAVSRQISALEAQLGVPLLVRRHRAIALTGAGERLFRSANAAVQQIQDVVGELRVQVAQRPVTLTASVGVTGLWLLRRLGRLQQAHPGLELRLSASNRIADLRTEQIDLAIRYCAADHAPPGAIALFGETIVPVAHPALGVAAIDSVQALQGLNLLELDDDTNPRLRWRHWLEERGWQGARPRAMTQFNQYDQVIHAALAGQGVALGRLELIRDLLDDRQLGVVAAPPPPSVAGDSFGYWLIQAEERPRPDVLKVVAWIRAEAAGHRIGG
ncbi:LysR family transcriptional regulator [Cupriavidus gilardii]|uniref:LysR substrate-binding domain-containing protein n=1 Tax=Cupriavidus gilardii TaxID=82541 RepID=UPI001ABE6019|nr:LysR substrate-binding domain-containing protein [Cupriavidus gilardii]MBO4122833.1 LysR family transcriptional regulator [Cupriavidus gilardii]